MVDIIAQVIKELEFYKQGPRVSAALNAIRLYTNGLRCEIVYEKKKFESSFIEGLDESICCNIRVYLGHHPRAQVTELFSYVDILIKIADRSMRTS